MSGEGTRRGARGLAVDLGVLAIGVFAWLSIAGERLNGQMPSPPWLFDLDMATGLLALPLLWLRRRWPTQAAVALIVASTYAETVAFPLVVMLFSVVVRRSLRTAAWVFAGAFAAGVVYMFLRPGEMSVPGSLGFSLALLAATAGWGMFVRYRRQLQARAAQAERDERERARQRARDELARELHDMLGHRLSLLSLHAGGMEYRPDAPAEELTRAAGVVREQSQLAMRDLREIIAILRAPIGELPQPTMADLRALVEEARPAMRIELHERVEGEVPERSGRTAYRIVQEALTNARKHAENAPVEITVDGQAEDGLNITVVSGSGRDTGPGSGHGLIGLEERAALAGGRLEYGSTADGGWRVHAWLPWTA
ncbi:MULTISPECIES: sensor histidine kinase [Glycomyces]|uniref:histidine kinase n=2 Tax=Glycomyces TaxID=58113 RepID=A0A9X3SWW0_9ACTN|nr:histidine kinase [Glycomyces lechevalierae]MDA1387749.1 histidine kinase [Glycomyces lechevalierae]MDR7337381.1 signal transduction histidine kinase [Glycomyces lechevalierae]